MSQICSASMYVSGYVSHVKSLPYSPINRCNVVQHNIALVQPPAEHIRHASQLHSAEHSDINH